MNTLGIYFGPRVISIVETKRKESISNIQIPRLAISTAELLEEKVPEEVKLVTLLKDELRKKGIEAKEITVCLSGKDLIIRTFEMPIFVSRGELRTNAVHFEAKKYIPFKVEELVSDFQWKFDKSIRRNHILFVGIKKDALDKYRFMITQLGFKINSIEYSAFSVLRLLRLTGVRDKGIIAMVDIDLIEDDESNFMVLEDGFPLFSRDITFVSESAEGAKAKEFSVDRDTALEKLKREMRISLDYYHRKFPAKNIKKIIFISSEDYRSELEAFIKDVGLSAQFIEISQYIGKPARFSLSFIKGYSSSLSKIIKTRLKIDLLTVRLPKEMAVPIRKIHLLVPPKVNPAAVALSLLICIAASLFSLPQRVRLQKEIRSITSDRPQVSTLKQDAGYEELTAADSVYRQKITTLDGLINKQLRLTLLLDIMPRILPEGVWLESFSFRQSEATLEVNLGGVAYLGDSIKEIEAVNSFVAGLKKEQVLNKYFKVVELASLNRNQGREGMVTNFAISCRRY